MNLSRPGFQRPASGQYCVVGLPAGRIRAEIAASAKHIILTAKHHDGFGLWPTKTTNYPVRSSPWRDGTGDMVAELAIACVDYGLVMGLDLSPWDRHEPSWRDDHAAYDRQHLAELCTRYGELFEIWFDGARSERHPYDLPSIMETMLQHQPNAMVFNLERRPSGGWETKTAWPAIPAGTPSIPRSARSTTADATHFRQAPATCHRSAMSRSGTIGPGSTTTWRP